MKNNVIIITGPTASGKSDIAIQIAKAFNGEIISADSQQVYQNMDIGTNKTKKFDGIKHHLLDIINPDENFSVEDFSNRANVLIQDINNRGKVPIIAGGTGFYIDSILFDMNYGQVSQKPKLRQNLQGIADEKGNEYLYNKLEDIDPKTAKKYHPNETNRIIRALEIYEVTGKAPSEVRLGEKELNKDINPILFFLNYNDRTSIYEKINNRVIKMIDEGLIEEFTEVTKKYNLDQDSQSMAAIGYKELFPFIRNEIDIDELIDLIQKNTRHYAKRQTTWMKRYLQYGFTHEIIMDNIDKNDAADAIISIIKETYEF
ncbi:tRNA (adenosine(37)-N6)-dimethylallyltransferase MiaA [Anaerococcus sp. mt242]|uniref:tRNA (adenosine(37)-N6)-dimethylallyltransferase MiaA n=1 Tax=Anaerococcus sp. mt242 TaxID=2661917 RepID=UPI001932994C|nr:tRNA (adenosine(37)-N6)-dimethylallyltransferase MiaA [Anaerococcus sp. mt242]MBM0045774.1 tRNA (adenosine(37)-N6)-dimethylallyltransferase MiaA [Anaerococcus sp. mt242]